MGRKSKSGYIDTESVNTNNYYSLPAADQETIINFMRGEDFATVCTSDSTMKTKFDKLCEVLLSY